MIIIIFKPSLFFLFLSLVADKGREGVREAEKRWVGATRQHVKDI